ncbi:hypothetical protein QE152_g39322 [Popillia japonica]|uniref:Uncharacterized protein n=1 Tax=Popillia japonica TaxID=7064 RepID=A0AAW1HU88_POPJA
MVNLSDGSSSEVSDEDDADVAQRPTGNVAVKSVPVCRWDLKFSGEPKTMSLSAFLSRVMLPLSPCLWDLKFSGEPKTMSLSAFLSRVEELRVARSGEPKTMSLSAFLSRVEELRVARNVTYVSECFFVARGGVAGGS